MKKKLLLALFAFPALTINAQITVTGNNLPEIGDRVFRATDNTNILNIGGNGANQSWSFINLTNDFSDTLDFINPAWTPCSADFSSSNMAMKHTAEDSVYFFYNKTASALKMTGMCQQLSDGSTMKMQAQYSLLTLPANYNNNHTETGRYVKVQIYYGNDPDGPVGPLPYIDSLRQTSFFRGNYVIDAWGDITTPMGTFSALRQNEAMYSTDTVWMYANNQWQIIDPNLAALMGISQVKYDTTYTVRWWTNDSLFKLPVVEFTYDTLTGNSVNGVMWLNGSTAVSVKENTMKNVTVYPVPANNTLTLNNVQNVVSVNIFDMTGKLVQTIRVNNQNRLVIATGNLANGIYFIRLNDINGQQVVRKISIQH